MGDGVRQLAPKEIPISLQHSVIRNVLSNAQTPKNPMAKILQVAYSRILLSTRAAMMESQGDSVISVAGNDEAMALKDEQLQGVDLIVIGSAATHALRTEIVRHFKKLLPKTPVLA